MNKKRVAFQLEELLFFAFILDQTQVFFRPEHPNTRKVYRLAPLDNVPFHHDKAYEWTLNGSRYHEIPALVKCLFHQVTLLNLI